MDKYYSDYHSYIGEGSQSYKYFDEWVTSDENRFFIFNESMNHFSKYENKYGVPILSNVDMTTRDVLNHYKELSYNYIKNKTFTCPLSKLSYMNKILVNLVMERVKSKKIDPVIDPLWTRKGPSFYEDTTFNKNKSNGYIWNMETDMFGNPKINDRFGNSKMYWNKANHLNKR